MLRITVHEDATCCRLKLAGRLAGPWVLEAEFAWRSELHSGRQIELDMRQLTGIDDSGRELLSAMYQAEVSLIGEGVWMRALIEELTAENHFDPATRRPPGKKIRADQGSRQQEKPEVKINSVLKLKHAAWASGALVAAILVIVVTHSGPKASVQAPPTPVVEVAAVTQKDVPIYGEWIGTLIGQVNADVKAQVTGYLLTRKYKEGTDWRFWWAYFDRWRCLLSWDSAIYFSASSYSTLGGNDVSLPPDRRTLGPLESVIGALMCGLSVNLLFAIVTRLISLHDSRASCAGGHRANAALGGRTPHAAKQ